MRYSGVGYFNGIINVAYSIRFCFDDKWDLISALLDLLDLSTKVFVHSVYMLLLVRFRVYLMVRYMSLGSMHFRT